MPDLNGWPIFCFILMAVVLAANYFYEKGSH